MKSFGERLLAWYDTHKRDLPWRHTSDPWAIWVSEIMLQQTRVEVVRQVFPAFMKRFPTPESLAKASDDQLLSAYRSGRGQGRDRCRRRRQRGIRGGRQTRPGASAFTHFAKYFTYQNLTIFCVESRAKQCTGGDASQIKPRVL